MEDLERIQDMINSVAMAEVSIGYQYDSMDNTDQCRGYLESAQGRLTLALEDLAASYRYANLKDDNGGQPLRT